MNLLWILGTLVAGAALGSLYFGGLWLTVRRLPATRRPSTLGLASLAGRGGILLVGLSVLMEYGWDNLLFSLAGVLLARSVIVAWLTMSLADTTPAVRGRT